MFLKMASIRLINHSSVLFEEEGNYILTDPWYQKPAFGSWLPVPPTSIHPSYLVYLSQAAKSFAILISHGHDDHFDDDFLSLFPSDTQIIIPKYRSKGVFFRAKAAGLNNILEVDMKGTTWSNFKIKSFINSDISGDDAILTIAGKEHFLVHANDNWQPLPKLHIETIRKDFLQYQKRKTLYMSQCNLADGWPNIYKDYSNQEKKKIHHDRVVNIILQGVKNCKEVGIENFLNYAGYAASFIQNKEHLRETTSFQSNSFVKNIAKKNSIDIEIIDMLPGDSFNFSGVKKLFPNTKANEALLKKSSFEFYEHYDIIRECDSYKEHGEPISVDMTKIAHKLDQFLLEFKIFVSDRVDKYNFYENVKEYALELKVGEASSVTSFGPDIQVDKKVTFFLEQRVANSLLKGTINWENLYVGYDSEIETTPKDTNAAPIIRWLSMYGYKYQRGVKSV
jgi:UDP-MurNAc hydroxylase